MQGGSFKNGGALGSTWCLQRRWRHKRCSGFLRGKTSGANNTNFYAQAAA